MDSALQWHKYQCASSKISWIESLHEQFSLHQSFMNSSAFIPSASGPASVLKDPFVWFWLFSTDVMSLCHSWPQRAVGFWLECYFVCFFTIAWTMMKQSQGTPHPSCSKSWDIFELFLEASEGFHVKGKLSYMFNKPHTFVYIATLEMFLAVLCQYGSATAFGWYEWGINGKSKINPWLPW